LLAPAAVAAKDAGPATKVPAAKKDEPKKVEPKAPAKKAEPKKKAEPAKKAPAAKKAEPKKVEPKEEPKKEAPASQPAKGEVELKKEDVKVTPPADDFDLWGAITGIIKNFKEGKVWDGIAIILMVLTFIFFKVKKELPVKYAVWIAAGLGIATNIVSAIVGGVDWGPAISAGLFQGAAAGGFWTMVGKHIFRSRLEKAKRAKAREMAEDGKASGEVETDPIKIETTETDNHEDDTK
jgi:hypothetical protein